MSSTELGTRMPFSVTLTEPERLDPKAGEFRELANSVGIGSLHSRRRYDVPENECRALRGIPNNDRLLSVKATMSEPEIVTRKGKAVSVIIPIKDYQELLERVEDADDVAWLKRARRKPLHYRPLEDYLAERNRK